MDEGRKSLRDHCRGQRWRCPIRQVRPPPSSSRLYTALLQQEGGVTRRSRERRKDAGDERDEKAKKRRNPAAYARSLRVHRRDLSRAALRDHAPERPSVHCRRERRGREEEGRGQRRTEGEGKGRDDERRLRWQPPRLATRFGVRPP